MVFYFVQRGETLFAIAQRYQTTVHAIVAANRLEDPNAICPGQALIIPRPGEVPSPAPGGIVHLVRPGETLFGLADRFGSTVREILLVNQIAHPEFVLPGQQLVIPEPAELEDDWPMVGRTPGRSGTTGAAFAGQPLVAWDYAPGHCYGVQPSAPVTRYDRVYVGLGDLCFYSMDQQTGDIKWRVAACEGEMGPGVELGDFTLAAPAIYDGLAYLCGPDGTIRAVDAHSGKAVWQFSLGGSICSDPIVAEGILYVGSTNRCAYALEAKTGAQIWRVEVDGGISHPVALGDERLFVVTDTGGLWALEAMTGACCWQAEAKVAQPPVFAELLLLVGGQAFDPSTGQRVWKREELGCSPVVRMDQVFYPGSLVDLFSGEDEVAARPIPVQGHLLAGNQHLFVTGDQRLVAWDPFAGHECWDLPLDAPGTGGLAVGVGLIFASLADGSLVAVRMGSER